MAYQNFYTTKLFTDIGAADTTITLETPPTALSGRLVLEARNATKREIIKYTGVSGNQITGVTRGQGGTTATTHTKNALVEMNLTSQDIQDLYDAFATFAAATGSWLTAVMTITSIVNNGNRSYDINTSTDMTSIISPGMRLRTTRTVAAPTQSTSLNGTTQYYSRTSASLGSTMTFTNNFVAGAWVKLSSYAGTSIISRFNGTSGWELELDATGRILLIGYNSGAANSRYVQSYQSIPLNKWVHVTAQLDMSNGTASPTFNYIMIDGVDVPAIQVVNGTAPTALIQAGNLEVGSRNGGLIPFPGKIAQAFVFNAKVTQATIRGYMSQGLSGTETSLISAYSFNNSINDLNTTNANNLTANGSAVATNADSPFGGQASGTISSTLDYGIVQKVTSSVITVQVPEGCTIPTTGGVSAVSYSTFKAPYGFPTEVYKFDVEVLVKTGVFQASATLGTIYNPRGLNLNIPSGAWFLGGSYLPTVTGSTAADKNLVTALSTSASAIAQAELSNYLFLTGQSVMAFQQSIFPQKVSLSVATPYYYVATCSGSGVITNLGLFGSNESRFIARCAYL